MKTCFLNYCFLNKIKSLLVLAILCLFLFTSCKCKRGCEGLDSKTEQLLSDGIKSALLQNLPADSSWVFKCVTTTSSHLNQKDSILLGEKEIYPLEKGDCALMDKGKCCSDYYNEKSNRKLTVVYTTTTGLNNFTNYYTDADGFGIKGDWGKIEILNHIYSQDFLTRFNETLKLKDTTLTDTRTAIQYLDASTPCIVSWSKQNGLVMYAYKIGTDTVKYERVDIK